MKVIITNSAEETSKVGKDFARELAPGDVLLFYGNLGAGKTTFIQGLAEGLGIKERILSPTFVLQRSHEVGAGGINSLNHIDLYRIEGQAGIDSIGLSEILSDEKSITIIEWAEKLKDFMPKKGFSINLEYDGEASRKIKIDKF